MFSVRAHHTERSTTEPWATTRTASGWATAPPLSWTRSLAVSRSTCAPPPARPELLGVRQPNQRHTPCAIRRCVTHPNPIPNPKQHPDFGQCDAAVHRDQLHVRLGRRLPARRARRLRAHPHGGEAVCSPQTMHSLCSVAANVALEAATHCIPGGDRRRDVPRGRPGLPGGERSLNWPSWQRLSSLPWQLTNW